MVENPREENESNGGAETVKGVGRTTENGDREETKADCIETVEGISDENGQHPSVAEGGKEGGDATVGEQQEQSSPEGEGLEKCVSCADQLKVGIQEQEPGGAEIGEREGIQNGAASEATTELHEKKETQPVQQSENGSA